MYTTSLMCDELNWFRFAIPAEATRGNKKRKLVLGTRNSSPERAIYRQVVRENGKREFGDFDETPLPKFS